MHLVTKHGDWNHPKISRSSLPSRPSTWRTNRTNIDSFRCILPDYTNLVALSPTLAIERPKGMTDLGIDTGVRCVQQN